MEEEEEKVNEDKKRIMEEREERKWEDKKTGKIVVEAKGTKRKRH